MASESRGEGFPAESALPASALDDSAAFDISQYDAGAGAELLTASLPDHGCVSDDGADATDEVEGRVAPFLVKLYEIVSSKSLDQHITWNAAGDTLRIVDPATFARDVLPLYFKHNNLRSFIRQLNMYGFYRGPTKGTRVIEFFHERFCRGGRAQLKHIKRCHVTKAKSKSTTDQNPTPAAAGAQAQADSEMDSLLGELGHVNSYILKLEEELMGNIVQLHSKLARILHKLELPGENGAATAAAAMGCCLPDMLAHAAPGGASGAMPLATYAAGPPAARAAAASPRPPAAGSRAGREADAPASGAAAASAGGAGGAGGVLHPAPSVPPIPPTAFAAAASAAGRCASGGACCGGVSSSVNSAFGCAPGAAPACPPAALAAAQVGWGGDLGLGGISADGHCAARAAAAAAVANAGGLRSCCAPGVGLGSAAAAAAAASAAAGAQQRSHSQCDFSMAAAAAHAGFALPGIRPPAVSPAMLLAAQHAAAQHAAAEHVKAHAKAQAQVHAHAHAAAAAAAAAAAQPAIAGIKSEAGPFDLQLRGLVALQAGTCLDLQASAQLAAQQRSFALAAQLAAAAPGAANWPQLQQQSGAGGASLGKADRTS